MNIDTVKPMPQTMHTLAKLRQLPPSGIWHQPSLMLSQEKLRTPVNLPTSRPRKTPSGDNTPGKCSPWSACKVKPELPFREYAYTRELVKRLIPILESEGYEVYNIVPEEYDVTLAERCKRINSIVKQAALEGKHTLRVSVHNNAAGNGKEWKEAYGWSVWTTRGQNNSDKLAQCLYDSAVEVLTPLGQKTRKDRSDGDDDYEAGFYIIKGSNCPAVLVENMFQDCIKEVQWMLTEEGKNALVEIHRRGINKFVELMKW